MDVERGSIDPASVPQTKLSSRGPDNIAYSMKRWLEQRPHEEPYCGLTLVAAKGSDYGELLIMLVVLYFDIDHEAKIWIRSPVPWNRKESLVGGQP